MKKILCLLKFDANTAQKCFPLLISSVNVTRSAENCGSADLVTFTEEFRNGKTFFVFFVHCNQASRSSNFWNDDFQKIKLFKLSATMRPYELTRVPIVYEAYVKKTRISSVVVTSFYIKHKISVVMVQWFSLLHYFHPVQNLGPL